MVPSGDAARFADALLLLLDDPERRARMGEAGREKALTFSWDRVVEETLDLYEEVLAYT
jgi:glycosyltransferase involved in cell wall biosynthesis